jgi:uncharacterized membrane protein
MSPTEWLNLFLRWFHLIAGIAWIGSSFYFIWLDRSLERAATADPDLEGSLWMVHSGGFYRVERRRIGPGRMPSVLHWFKWEAALTWISGVGLLGLVYHATGGLYLIDPAVSNVTPGLAAGLSFLGLIAAWFVYDGLWQWGGRTQPRLAAVLSWVLLIVAAWGFLRFLSGRAAFVHIGAMLGTIMVANVWVRILPAQQKMIDATREGRTPDFTLGEAAKHRSVHNSYVTFPVLILMLSPHFPGLYAGGNSLLALLSILVIGVAARHLMIGDRGRGWAVVPLTAALIAMFVASPPGRMAPATGAIAVDASAQRPATFANVQAIVLSRCVSCHSAAPRIDTFGAAPGGVSFDDPREIRRWADRIGLRVVHTRTMPLGNLTLMTDQERDLIARWLAAGALERE